MMEHIEAEGSEDFDDGSMIFNDDAQRSNEKKKIKQAVKNATGDKDGGVQFQRGQTMYINGKPIKVDKNNLALNKREKANWLVHMLFIRQDYTECLKYVDQLIED